MSWRSDFEKGTLLFKQKNYVEALVQFNQAITHGGEKQYILYDSRAATHEHLDQPKSALRDAKKTIELAPHKWQGYARSARLFMKTYKFDSAIKMVDLALLRIQGQEEKRREELHNLKRQIVDAHKQERRNQNHMLKLPLEIYEEIFQLVIAQDSAYIIHLLHVCGYWRRIIYETPGLWRTLVLSARHPDKKASLWLTQSCCRLRALHVLRDCELLPELGKPSFLDKIDWGYLRTFRIHHRGILKYITPQTMFRELETLEIDSGNIPIPYDFFREATKLQTLSLRNTLFFKAHLVHHFPCLSSLNLEGCSLTFPPFDFIDFLAANPQIHSLHLETPTTVPISLNREEALELPNLTHLEAVRCAWASFILLLGVPGLQTIHFAETSHPSLTPHFNAWLSTSPRSLTKFILKRVPIAKDTLINLVQMVPTIEMLVIVGISDTSNAVVETLARGDTHDRCLCPRLKHLDVSHCPDVESMNIHALVKQRLTLSAEEPGDKSASVDRLEVLKMDGCPKVDINWLPWVRERVAEVSCIYATGRQKSSTARRV